MKKLIVIALLAGFIMAPAFANAEDKSVTGGFEAAGHVMTGLGFQAFSKKAGNTGVCSSYFTNDGDIGYFAGPVGKYIGKVPYASSKHFQFFVDEVELDIIKSFGENIRIRADLDFGRFASGSGADFILEQAYATANIPVGNGIEFLIGRFNTPIGFEGVDPATNLTISKSVIATGLRPTNTTGAKIYYSFSDLVDLHFYVVNTLTQDSTAKINNIPSLGMRLGFNWGAEGSQSTVGISGLFGPETRVSNKHYTYAADLDLNWWITEAFAIGAEALYRRDNSISGSAYDNVNYISGLLNLHYVFNDQWDGTLQYTWAKQYKTSSNGVAPVQGVANIYDLTGEHQSMHQIVLAGGYNIVENAKVKLEGRFDMVKPVGASTTWYVYGGAVAFAYNF